MRSAKRHRGVVRRNEGVGRLRPVAFGARSGLHLRRLRRCRRPCGGEAHPNRLRHGVLWPFVGGRAQGLGEQQGGCRRRCRAVLWRSRARLPRNLQFVQRARLVALRGCMRVVRRQPACRQPRRRANQGARGFARHLVRGVGEVGEDGWRRRGWRYLRQRHYACRPREVVVLPGALPRCWVVARLRARRGWPEFPPAGNARSSGLRGRRDVASHDRAEKGHPLVVRGRVRRKEGLAGHSLAEVFAG
mmetsp:Transcript_125239/g.359692  ORF Transcript_125239/g.359692 Transcript_125239/m.359692 type:complete len:246 (+) Transcript_125239:1089-1826(+)